MSFAGVRSWALLLLVLGTSVAGFTRDDAGAKSASAAPMAESHPALDANTPEELWYSLMTGNRRFMRGALEPRAVIALRTRLAGGQQPKIAVLACADSHVSPELVFDKALGDLYVVRTAGNIADPVTVGGLEYAVEHLHVKVIAVIGHEKCDAVARASAGENARSNNLAAIVNTIRPAIAKAQLCADPVQMAMNQVEANIRECAASLTDRSAILKSAVDSQQVRIFRGIYHLTSGEVTRLVD